MKVLVTGSKGQLGQEILECSQQGKARFTFTDSDQLDILNSEQVEDFLENLKPDFVVNCAAYTAVDKAEDESQIAYALNAEAPARLAEACGRRKIFLVHFSTDYVFDGKQNFPYSENAPTNPLSAYGLSKRDGERKILEAGFPAAIIRTSWLYSSKGNNFVRTMLKLGFSKPEIRVVNDQRGSPTAAADLARFIMGNLQKLRELKTPQIYHYSNEGEISWYEFTLAIQKLSNFPAEIIDIPTSEYPTKATRPQYSVLSKEKTKADFRIEVPDWMESLKREIHRFSMT